MNNLVNIQDNQAVTTSKQIALTFGKRHADVLRDIKNLISQVDDDFAKRNFAFTLENKYLGNVERPTPSYIITKDGFALLVMGYTGQKAIKFKLAYIKAFNQMQEALLTKELSAIAQYNKWSLVYDDICDKASTAGRVLNYLGKQVKPEIKAVLDGLHDEINPQLPFGADDE